MMDIRKLQIRICVFSTSLFLLSIADLRAKFNKSRYILNESSVNQLVDFEYSEQLTREQRTGNILSKAPIGCLAQYVTFTFIFVGFGSPSYFCPSA